MMSAGIEKVTPALAALCPVAPGTMGSQLDIGV